MRPTNVKSQDLRSLFTKYGEGIKRSMYSIKQILNICPKDNQSFKQTIDTEKMKCNLGDCMGNSSETNT